MKKKPAVLKLRPWEEVEVTQVLIKSGRRELISNFISQNASRAERVNSPAFSYKTADPQTEARIQLWQNAIDSKSKWTFSQINSIRGFNNDTIIKSLQNVSLKDETLLPRWGTLVVELLEQIFISNITYKNLFEPFQDILLKRIHSCFQHAVKLNIKDKVYLSLTDTIVSKWSELFADLPKMKISCSNLQSAFLELFTTYPIIIRRMSEIVISALDHVTSLCTHLIKDKQALSTEFNIGLEDVMILNNIEIGSGDCHNCGSSVSRVIFENGAILIYKPKNLKIAKWFGDLSKELFTGMNKDIQLKYPVRLLREKYTWEEFISEKPCKKEEDIRLFYNRVGVLIQLAQATRCQDLHGENIIASGSYPIPIDLEAIASPLPKVIKKNFKWLDSIITSYFQSPLCLGILPTLEIKSNGDVFYDTTFPSKHRDAVRSHICLPMLNGKAEFIENYVEEIIDGYISARKAMEINFKNDNGRLFNFKDYLIRFIPRNTSLYAKILKETSAKHPKTFIDSELLYEIAMYSSPITEKYLIAIIDQEIWALSHGDIPFFTSQPGSKSISSNNNIPIHVGFVPIDLNLFVSNLLITNPLKLDVFLIRTAIGVLNFPT